MWSNLHEGETKWHFPVRYAGHQAHILDLCNSLHEPVNEVHKISKMKPCNLLAPQVQIHHINAGQSTKLCTTNGKSGYKTQRTVAK